MKTNYYYKINYFTQYIDRDVYKTDIKIQDMKVVNTEATWCTFQTQAQGQKKPCKSFLYFSKNNVSLYFRMTVNQVIK